MEVVTATALLLLLVKALVDLLKRFKSDRPAAFTQLATFAVAVGVVFLFAATPFGAGVALLGVSLAGAAVATKVLFGLALAAGAMGAHDTLKAVDNTQSAAVPPLFKE
jgi:fatty acid desaturase